MAIYGDGKHDDGVIASFLPKRTRPRKSFKCILYTCDRWKSTKSKSVYGIFTSRIKLNKELRKIIRENIAEVSDDFDNKSLRKSTIRELNDSITYIYVELFDDFNAKL